MSYGSEGNINWAFGDGGDVGDLIEECSRLGYEPLPNDDTRFWHPKDDTDGDTIKTEAEMWQYIEDYQQSVLEDAAEYEAMRDD